jgi:beta-lactamase regulating signal transducer with metallopeptidase domain
MNLVKLLTSPTADALGWTLLHAVWQGFAIVLPTAVALHLLRNRSSALRYQLGILALATQLLTSVGTFSYYFDPAVVSVSPNATQAMARAWQQSAQVLPWHQQVRQFLESNLSQFVALYLIGLVVFGLRLAGGWLYLQRLSRSANTPANALWNTVVNQLRATMALRPVIQIRESASIAVPIVVGILKPVLLIPVGLATSLSIQEIEAVLAHELAHVKRQDYTVNLLQSFIDVLYFFHPALWWLSARVREERELCCDDLAIQACGGNGRRLAQALARIEELRLIQTASTPALAMAFATKRQQLLHRVRRILGVPTRPIVSTRSLAGLTLVTVLLVSASVYAVQQQQPKPKKTKSTPIIRYQLGQRKEFGIINQSQLEYVIWNGKRLSTKQVAQLSTQLQDVFAGTLSLDNVAQPNRDILLAVIESRYTSLSIPENREKFRRTIDSLRQTDWYTQKAEGLARIDHKAIVASALTNIPLSPDGTVEGLVKVNYDSIIKRAFSSIDTSRLSSLFRESEVQSLFQNLEATRSQLVEATTDRPASLFFDDRAKRLQDHSASLFLNDTNRRAIGKSRDLSQINIAILKAQAEQQRFAAEAAKRQLAVIDAQRFRLEQQRMANAMEQQRIIMQTRVARSDSAQAVLSRQIDESERAILKAEAEIEKVNQRLIEKQKAIEDAMKPIQETETKLRKLGYSAQQVNASVSAFGEAGVITPFPSGYPVIEGQTIHLAKPAMPPAAPSNKTQSIKSNVIRLPKPPVPPKALTIEFATPDPAVAPAQDPKPASKK